MGPTLVRPSLRRSWGCVVCSVADIAGRAEAARARMGVVDGAEARRRASRGGRACEGTAAGRWCSAVQRGPQSSSQGRQRVRVAVQAHVPTLCG